MWPRVEQVELSCFSSFQLGKALPEFYQRLLCLSNEPQAFGSGAEMTFSPASAFGRGFSEAGLDEPLCLKSCQGIVDAAQQYFAPGCLLNLIGNGNTVGIVAYTDDCEHHHQLKVA